MLESKMNSEIDLKSRDLYGRLRANLLDEFYDDRRMATYNQA